MNDLTQRAQDWAESGLKLTGEQASFRVRRCNTLSFSPPQSKGATSQVTTKADDSADHPFSASLTNLISSASHLSDDVKSNIA
jgi:hypothetical protein